MTFASGGWISPIADDGDSVPAMLSEGEARVGADWIKRYGAELDARQLATRLWNHLAGEAHMPSLTGGCWCAPAAGVGRHVNEDGSRC